MEDVNAALKAADDIVDCSMIQKMSWFKERIEASGMFMLDNLRLNLSNNEKYGTVVIPIKRQNLMEEVMDVIRESINVNILYTVNSEKGKTMANRSIFHAIQRRHVYPRNAVRYVWCRRRD